MFNLTFEKNATQYTLKHFCVHLFFMCGLLALSACSVTPAAIVKTPTTATPVAPTQASPKSGAIYNASAYRPLFEDRRARMVGDVMTIIIAENTKVEKDAESSSNKKGSVKASAAVPVGLPFNIMNEDISLAANSDIDYEDEAEADNSYNFNGSITVTVVDVLANGNLVVSGEKQIALDKGTEFVRFSGVVNPDTITLGNVVTSTKVADARIEYRTNSTIDGAQIASILTRFFLTFAPF